MQGHDWVRALCGAGIERPVLIIDAEGDLQDPETMNNLGNCAKCKAVTLPADGYIYGCVAWKDFVEAMNAKDAAQTED